MDDRVHPQREGTRQSSTVLDANGYIEKHEFTTGSAESLKALQEEWVFYTPAILYLHGRVNDAPLADFINSDSPGAHFCFKKFDYAMFRGLSSRDGDSAWNYVLWAMRKPYWDRFVNWMLSIGLTYADTKTAARIGLQELQVLDPVAYGRTKEVSTLDIYSFGLTSNVSQVALSPSTDVLLSPPGLHVALPKEDMTVFAASLFSGRNPLNDVSNHRREKKERPDARKA